MHLAHLRFAGCVHVLKPLRTSGSRGERGGRRLHSRLDVRLRYPGCGLPLRCLCLQTRSLVLASPPFPATAALCTSLVSLALCTLIAGDGETPTTQLCSCSAHTTSSGPTNPATVCQRALLHCLHASTPCKHSLQALQGSPDTPCFVIAPPVGPPPTVYTPAHNECQVAN